MGGVTPLSVRLSTVPLRRQIAHDLKVSGYLYWYILPLSSESVPGVCWYKLPQGRTRHVCRDNDTVWIPDSRICRALAIDIWRPSTKKGMSPRSSEIRFSLLFPFFEKNSKSVFVTQHKARTRGLERTKTWYQFYRINVHVGHWGPWKIFLPSKMKMKQHQHKQKREIVDLQKIKYKYKSINQTFSHSIKSKKSQVQEYLL